MKKNFDNYETIESAGYKYISYNKESKEHILFNTHTGTQEVFYSNKNHAGWALIYKNTHLEFCYSLK